MEGAMVMSPTMFFLILEGGMVEAMEMAEVEEEPKPVELNSFEFFVISLRNIDNYIHTIHITFI